MIVPMAKPAKRLLATLLTTALLFQTGSASRWG